MDFPTSPFLRLPRELRDAIYREYVLADGGFIFNPHSNRLRKATAHEDQSGAIDLSLAYTCRQIAHEMKGVALSTNLVTFKTLYLEELRLRAGRYLGLIDLLYYYTGVAAALAYNICSHRVRSLILAEYPWFGPYLDEAVAQHANHPRGINNALQANDHIKHCTWIRRQGSQIRTRSLVREAILFTLKLCLEQDGVHDTLEIWWGELVPSCINRKLKKMPDFLELAARHRHWSIPSQSDIDTLFDLLHSKFMCLYGHDRHGGDCRTLTEPPNLENLFVGEFKDGKYRFSAAAAAIRFFESFPGIHRAMRNLLIHEDRDAVPWASSHGRGLVKFCIDNPLLRIERRVDLWWNIFPESMGSRIEERFAETDDWLDKKRPTLRKKPATRAIAQWVMEAAELTEMPRDCFRLTLDGGAPGPANVCSEIFHRWVQLAAAEQIALRLIIDREGPRKQVKTTFSREDMDTPTAMYFETGFSGFPDELSKIVAGTSVVKCLNFSPGFLRNVEKLVQARHGWKLENWQNRACVVVRFPQSSVYPTFFDPVAPLPQWIEILMHGLVDYESARRYAVDEGYL